MSGTEPHAPIAVLGAGGVVGRRIVAELEAARVPVRPLRRADANVFDAGSLARVLSGASVVINATAPLAETASPVLVASMAAGAHYVDAGGTQAVLRVLFERHDSTVRRAGLVALPAAGLDGLVGDLAIAWAASHIVDERSAGDGGATATSADGRDARAVRTEPAARIAEERPLDEACVSYVFDDLVLSAGSQRALFAMLGTHPIVWRRDRWEDGRAGDHRAVNAGPSLGGERDALAVSVTYPGGGGPVITIPRHVAASFVATYVSTTRRSAASGVLRLLARAAPLVPRAAAEHLAPYAPPDADYTRTRFGVVAQVRRGFSAAQIVVRGQDLYRTTAIACAWAARQLATRRAGPVGMRAPGELFRAAPALREIASISDLTIEPSFGS